MNKFDIIVIGASAGGLAALEKILPTLGSYIPIPIVIVQHISPDSGNAIVNLLQKYSGVELSEPLDKEPILANHIYLAPADYHLMIEKDKTFSLNFGPKENYCRPSIDVLFETASEVYLSRTLGIILTGANTDGTKGCLSIKKYSGTVIAQDPNEATISVMPLGAINANCTDFILNLDDISKMISNELKE